MMLQKKVDLEKSVFTSRDILMNINFECAKEDIKQSDASAQQVKELTVNMMSEVSKIQDTDLMCRILHHVNTWKTDKTLTWKNSLIEYGRTHRDITAIYAGNNGCGGEFVLVADSVITQEVLDHNEFCFELCDRYSDIDNFMVLDREEFSCIKEEYSDYKKVYQRGL